MGTCGGAARRLAARISRLTKKDAYVDLSLALLAFLTTAIAHDVVCVLTEHTEQTTQSFSLAVLVVHAVAFYLGLLGFVYVTQAAAAPAGPGSSSPGRAGGKAVAAVLGNCVVSVFRVAYEVNYYTFRKEVYHS